MLSRDKLSRKNIRTEWKIDSNVCTERRCLQYRQDIIDTKFVFVSEFVLAVNGIVVDMNDTAGHSAFVFCRNNDFLVNEIVGFHRVHTFLFHSFILHIFVGGETTCKGTRESEDSI